jgi:hypothetical protein
MFELWQALQIGFLCKKRSSELVNDAIAVYLF